MSPNLDYYTIRKVLSRFLSVGVVAVIVSITSFGLSAFNLQSIHFEIMVNGVAIAAAYSTLKSGVFQNKHVAGLMVMIFMLVLLPLPVGGWGLVSMTSYLVGLTAAVSFYCSLARKHPVRGRAWRISVAFLILGLADVLVFSFLQVASLRMFGQPVGVSPFAFRTLWEGLMMTTISAVAFEFAELLVQLSDTYRAVVH